MERIEFPGPTWHDGISHGLRYNHEAKTVEILAILTIGGEKVTLRATSRSMTGDEIIMSDMRGQSRENIQKALGIWEEPQILNTKSYWWKFW